MKGTQGDEPGGGGRDPAGALLEEILVDAYEDGEACCAFLEAFADTVAFPADAFVIGRPVSVVGLDYNGDTRCGLRAACRCEDGAEHEVAACDLRFPGGSGGALLVSAYRRWLGLGPLPDEGQSGGRPRRHKAGDEEIEPGAPVDLVVLAVRMSVARCRILGSLREVTFRSGDVWETVPGEILTVRVRKRWRFSGHPYVSGGIEGRRLEVGALGIVPLRLEDQGLWDPAEEYWGEEGEPLEEWARPIVARGPRPAFEMEQVLPGWDPREEFDDPVGEAAERNEGGDPGGARRILMDLLAADLRCLDAHAHLGNLVFDHSAGEAIRNYEAGAAIGELSLDSGFDGLLPWGLVDNRPFLRCLHGRGLCLWRLGRSGEAAALFERMLWLNPSDNQGARFLLGPARAGDAWRDDEG